jgi:hypothetical protein
VNYRKPYTAPAPGASERCEEVVLLGESLFPVYHERTDVAIDPGLRELWAHGSAYPVSDWGHISFKPMFWLSLSINTLAGWRGNVGP